MVSNKLYICKQGRENRDINSLTNTKKTSRRKQTLLCVEIKRKKNVKNKPKNSQETITKINIYTRKINAEREREDVLWSYIYIYTAPFSQLTFDDMQAVRFARVSMHFLVHVLTFFDSCWGVIKTRVTVLVKHFFCKLGWINYVANQFVNRK